MRGIKGLVWEGSVLDADEVNNYYILLFLTLNLSCNFRVSVSKVIPFLNAKSSYPLLKVVKNPSLKVYSGY
jgi:phage-related protein